MDTAIQPTTLRKKKASKAPQQLHLVSSPPNMNKIFIKTTTKILDCTTSAWDYAAGGGASKIPMQIPQAGSKTSHKYSAQAQRRQRLNQISTRGTNTLQYYSTQTGRGDVAPLMVRPFPWYSGVKAHQKETTSRDAPRRLRQPPIYPVDECLEH